MTFILALLIALSTPCELEDSTNCTWNASQQGNGTGSSFVDVYGTAYSLEGNETCSTGKQP